MTTELTVLAWAIVLLVAHIAMQAGLAVGEQGLPYALGPQDEERQERGVVARRARRAARNMLETFPIFVALALALAVTNKSGGIAAAGAVIWIAARAVYLPVYLMGIPYLRTLVWVSSFVGLILMLVKLLG
jgi:uncharacterized MAPEG superfamily protein